MQALDGARAQIRDIPLENIAGLAKDWFGDASVIPLWFGEGDVPAPAFIGEAMSRAVAAGHVFYTHQNGIPELREALATYLSGLGARTIGPEVRSVRMDAGPDGWALDLGKLAASLDGRTRAVFFASPGNPTGAMIPIEVQAAMLELCRARGVWLIADEVYNRLAFGVSSAPTILDIAEPEDRLIVINSFSKSWAMTGWRLGWTVHPPSLGLTLAMLTQYTTSGVTTFLQHAGVAAIRQGEPFVASMRAYCEAGMEIVCGALERSPRVRMGPRPRAGMYAFFEVDGMPDARQACLDILAATRVGLAPGTFFGPGSEGYLRACVCRSPDVLRQAMERLAPALA